MKINYSQDKNETLLSSLSSHAIECGKNRLRSLIKEKQVRVNGNKVNENINLAVGDKIEAFIPDSFFASIDINIIFEDDNIVIVDKPLKVDSMAALPRLLEGNGIKAYPVHRLDTNTTGIIILAKNNEYKELFVKAFRNNEVHKTYKALVVGNLYPKKGVLRHYLVKDARNSLVKAYDNEVDGSVLASTKYEVLNEKDGLSELLLYPETGRTHQLRVQLAAIGHPILGDGKYGKFETNKLLGVKEQKLRAVALEIDSRDRRLSKYNNTQFKVNDYE